MSKIFTLSNLLVNLVAIPAFSQESLNAGGGNASGAGGTVSYSIGQVACSSVSGVGFIIDQGVQHTYEVLALGKAIVGFNLIVHTFPNPCAEYIVLSGNQSELDDMNYQLNDIQSKQVGHGKLFVGQTQIDVSHLSPAIYLLNIIKNNQVIQSFKIIKK